MNVLKMHSTLLVFIISLLLVPASLEAQSPARRSWAIVIGVNDYNRAPDLHHAVNDAKSLSVAFRSLGFSGEFELRFGLVFGSEGQAQTTLINLESDGLASVPGVSCSWDAYYKRFSVTFGEVMSSANSTRGYMTRTWESRTVAMKPVGTKPQLEVEVVIRREIVPAGNKQEARYSIITNGDTENPIVTRRAQTSFDTLSFSIGSDRGNVRLRGIRRIQLLPVIPR